MQKEKNGMREKRKKEKVTRKEAFQLLIGKESTGDSQHLSLGRRNRP